MKLTTLTSTLFASVFLSFCITGCIFNTEARKENARRMVDRSELMYENKAEGKDSEIRYYVDQVIDSKLNIIDIGEPKISTDITNEVEVKKSQEKYKDEQEVKGILKTVWAKLLGLAASFFGFGGVLMKVNAGRSRMSNLFTSSVLGVQKFKDKIDGKLSTMGLDEEEIRKIKDELNIHLKSEASKVKHGESHSSTVEAIKRGN